MASVRHYGSALVRRCLLVKIISQSLIGQVFSAVQNSQHCAKMRRFLSPLFFSFLEGTSRVQGLESSGVMHCDCVALCNIVYNFRYYTKKSSVGMSLKIQFCFMKQYLKANRLNSTFYLTSSSAKCHLQDKSCITACCPLHPYSTKPFTEG